MADQHLTAERFLGIAERQLLIRCIVALNQYDATTRMAKETSVFVYSVCTDTSGKQSLFRIVYKAEEGGQKGKENNCRNAGSITDISLLGSTKAEQKNAVEKILYGWRCGWESIPFLSTNPLVAVKATGRKRGVGTFEEISPTGLLLMEHYARIESLLAQSLCGDNEWRGALQVFYNRFVPFLQAQNEKWEQVTGMPL